MHFAFACVRIAAGCAEPGGRVPLGTITQKINGRRRL